MHFTHWTEIFWQNLSFIALSLFAIDQFHLIAQLENKARMTMKQKDLAYELCAVTNPRQNCFIYM